MDPLLSLINVTGDLYYSGERTRELCPKSVLSLKNFGFVRQVLCFPLVLCLPLPRTWRCHGKILQSIYLVDFFRFSDDGQTAIFTGVYDCGSTQGSC